tara:strand:- start:319 stop:942 length:624 start_codon:yes stop_codon:yes gene_type:complete
MPYLGTQPNNIVKNTGLYTPSEILQLEKDGNWGGSLELIQEQTVSAVSGFNLTDIKESIYDVHLLQFNSVHTVSNTSNTTYRLRVSTDGGSSFVTSGYQYAVQDGSTIGAFNEFKSTSASEMFLTFTSDNATNNANANGYCYIYNLGNSSKYSFTTLQSMAQINSSTGIMWFGGNVYPQANIVNALNISTSTGFNFDGHFKLFGVKQ